MIHNLIYIRKLYPAVSMSFPPPGKYTGKVMLILPDQDDSILARMSPDHSNQIVLEFVVSEWITAEEILALVREQRDKFAMLSRKFSHPLMREFIDYLRTPRTRGEKADKLKLINVGFPLDPHPD